MGGILRFDRVLLGALITRRKTDGVIIVVRKKVDDTRRLCASFSRLPIMVQA